MLFLPCCVNGWVLGEARKRFFNLEKIARQKLFIGVAAIPSLVDLSVRTILLSGVRIPSTQSIFFH